MVLKVINHPFEYTTLGTKKKGQIVNITAQMRPPVKKKR